MPNNNLWEFYTFCLSYVFVSFKTHTKKVAAVAKNVVTNNKFQLYG